VNFSIIHLSPTKHLPRLGGDDEAEKEIVPRKAVRKANPIAPRPATYAVWVSLMALKAGCKRPAALARAAPTAPARGADEGGARTPPHGAPALGEEVSYEDASSSS
jgi:hypothetical protein